MIILQQTRGTLSSGDQCSLDLPFAATKSLTARIGPKPDFTRASTATFIGSDGLIQTAATNAPRFDHDPVTLVCKGLLIEDSRTNIIRYSGDLMNAVWTNGSGSVRTATTVASPADALSFATLISEDTSTGLHRFQQGSIARTSGTTYTFSIYAKQNGNRALAMDMGVLSNASAKFDLNNGTIIATTVGTSAIQYVGNGWYRCSMTGTATATGNSTVFLDLYNKSTSNINYAGDGSSGLYLWGGQFEAGAFATSYIPTTTASAVRSADVCSITGANFTSFCNQTEGTLSLKSTILASTATGALGGVSLSAADRFNCSVAIQKSNSTTTNANVILPYNSYAASFNFANATYGSESKTIIAFRQDDYASSSNGATVLTDTAGVFSTGTYPLNQMQIGQGGGTRMYGWISEIKYYRKRLPNAKLQALTL